MNRTSRFALPILLSLGFLTPMARAETAGRQLVRGQVPKILPNLAPARRLPPDQRLELAISLSLRNQADLTNLLEQLYDPSSSQFRRYLTPEQFTERFGPTLEDYEAVKAFAKSNHLSVTGTFANRQLLDISGAVADIENSFHVTMHSYRHPTEARDFYAPDTEPSVDLAVPLLEIHGLSDYAQGHCSAHVGSGSLTGGSAGGSGPSGYYRGNDFRNAYIPGVTLNGSGQFVGLVEFDNYYASDITTYETQAGLPNVSLQNVLIDTTNYPPSNITNSVGEVSLDIEMVISMGPNLSKLFVFIGPQNFNAKNWMDMLNSMASSNQIQQFSSSWYPGSTIVSGDQTFQTMAAQGQSFFQASGDGCAYVFPVPWPGDSPYVTSVGGTTLTMTDGGASYVSETVWNSGFQGTNNVWFANGSSGYWGSGGGVSTTYPIPSWQLGVNMSGVGGSISKRNLPDVALTANQVWVNCLNGSSLWFWGTSCAAPLWAGFAALVNQQCAMHNRPPIGFINPALYALGKSEGTPFHDITTGNSNWSTNAFYSAATGYDLCTGWGTPTVRMISALEHFAGPVWVDFSVAGPGSGTFDDPYNTLGLGITNVPVNGTVAIKGPNSTPVTPIISKPLILNASGGQVLIGH